MAHGLFYPAFNAIALEDASPGERGKIMSVFNAAFHAGSSLSLVFGVLAAYAGYAAVFVCTSSVVLGGLTLLAVGGRSEVRSAPGVTPRPPHPNSGAAATSV